MAHQNLHILGVTDHVEAALKLLERFKDNVVSGIGVHGTQGPIGAAFVINAEPTYDTLHPVDRKKLEDNRWTAIEYNAFMSWYEGPSRGLKPKIEKFLRERFESKKSSLKRTK